MPYILFTTHHRQRATNQETRCTTLLHSGSSSTCNHSSVTGGQHASWLIHVDHNEAEKSLHFVLLLQCSVTKKCYSVSCIHTLSLPPDHNLQTLCFIKMEIDHLLTMFDFKASQCTFFLSYLLFEKKPTVNQMDCKSMRAGCWAYISTHYAASLLSLGFSPFDFFLSSRPSHHSENNHSVTFKHANPNLFHI